MKSGTIHHIEIYVNDLKRSADFWGWFLESFGYEPYQEWNLGRSWRLVDTYLVFVQVEERFKDVSYHRCRVGLNHLAFYGNSQQHIDEITENLKERGVKILYSDKHPKAGGNYAVYFEDPDRIKVEVVAPDPEEERILSRAQEFLKKTLESLKAVQFNLEKHWHIDHLCYRTSSEENYSEIKEIFSRFSRLLIESEVNGRMISTYKLHTPIVCGDWSVDLIEVPAPKKGKVTPEGFEHFEVVCDLTFTELKKRYHQFQFNDGGLSKDLNQELEFSFEGFAVKFHHLSLESVINLERNADITKVLKDSQVLKILREYTPLIAGTFPLGLHVENSDLDVIVSVSDLKAFADLMTKEFSHLKDFQLFNEIIDGEPALRVHFLVHNIPVEIIGQKTASVRQTAYLHFLLEERILKLNSSYFRTQIRMARDQGLKTEPAFAKVLKIAGDPYKELLRLQGLSNADLCGLF